MAGANLAFHQPINSVETTPGLTPFTESVAEKAGQTFKLGVPVQVNAGYVQEWDGATLANAIAGFSMIPASNLASNGKGSPGQFSQIGPPGSISVYGSVPNQPSAVNVPVGAPMTDGRTLFEASIGNTIFEGTYDNSAGLVAADYTPLQTQIGSQAGLTKDANGTWYVDGGKVTAGTNTCVVIVGINPVDLVASGTPNTYIVNARVRFQVLQAARQVFMT